jgi:hypothetical protein
MALLRLKFPSKAWPVLSSSNSLITGIAFKGHNREVGYHKGKSILVNAKAQFLITLVVV